MQTRTYALIAGVSYLVIFFAAIFANFFVLDALLQDPVGTVENNGLWVRLGIVAFLVTAVFDVFVAWALCELYKTHPFTLPSTYFRLAHAIIMGVAVFALPLVFLNATEDAILEQVTIFNTIWLIGLFFFGVHLLFLGRILKHIRIIPWFLMAAGVMYMVDTAAHFLFQNYSAYAGVFLALVAVPSILGEMSLALWLLVKGGKEEKDQTLQTSA